jgi:hypothetical protein
MTTYVNNCQMINEIDTRVQQRNEKMVWLVVPDLLILFFFHLQIGVYFQILTAFNKMKIMLIIDTKPEIYRSHCSGTTKLEHRSGLILSVLSLYQRYFCIV